MEADGRSQHLGISQVAKTKAVLPEREIAQLQTGPV